MGGRVNGDAVVTVSLSVDERPEVRLSLYPDSDTRIETRVCGETPILVVRHGDAEVKVWPNMPGTVTGGDVTAARRLVEAATAYLGHVERLHAAGNDRAETASPAA